MGLLSEICEFIIILMTQIMFSIILLLIIVKVQLLDPIARLSHRWRGKLDTSNWCSISPEYFPVSHQNTFWNTNKRILLKSISREYFSVSHQNTFWNTNKRILLKSISREYFSVSHQYTFTILIKNTFIKSISREWFSVSHQNTFWNTNKRMLLKSISREYFSVSHQYTFTILIKNTFIKSISREWFSVSHQNTFKNTNKRILLKSISRKYFSVSHQNTFKITNKIIFLKIISPEYFSVSYRNFLKILIKEYFSHNSLENQGNDFLTKSLHLGCNWTKGRNKKQNQPFDPFFCSVSFKNLRFRWDNHPFDIWYLRNIKKHIKYNEQKIEYMVCFMYADCRQFETAKLQVLGSF